MADDINFLSSGSKPSDGPAPKKPKASSGDMSMHVPEAPKPVEAPKPAGGGFLSGLRGLMPQGGPKGPAPEDVFKPKVSAAAAIPSEPVLPKKNVPPPVIARPTPPPPRPIAPPPPPPPKAPTAPPRQEKSGTLRVSLISTSSGGSLSELAVRDRLRTIVLVMILALVLDGLIEGGLLYYKATVAKRAAGVEQGIVDLDAQIAKVEATTRPAKNLQALLKGAESALKNHRHWTQALAVVESLIKPEVRLTNLTGGETGNMLSGLVAKDYTTLAKQILVFKNDPRVKKFDVGNGGGKGEGGITGTMNLQLDPGIFLLAGDAKK